MSRFDVGLTRSREVTANDRHKPPQLVVVGIKCKLVSVDVAVRCKNNKMRKLG